MVMFKKLELDMAECYTVQCCLIHIDGTELMA